MGDLMWFVFAVVILLLGLYLQGVACVQAFSGEREAATCFFFGGLCLGLSVLDLLILLGHGWPLSTWPLVILGPAIASVFYFIPAIVAGRRSHPNALAILALNVLLGWSFFGWAGALVWALTESAKHTNTDTSKSRLDRAYVKPDDGKVACTECGRRVSQAFLSSDGRCQRCYTPSWSA